MPTLVSQTLRIIIIIFYCKGRIFIKVMKKGTRVKNGSRDISGLLTSQTLKSKIGAETSNHLTFQTHILPVGFPLNLLITPCKEKTFM